MTGGGENSFRWLISAGPRETAEQTQKPTFWIIKKQKKKKTKWQQIQSGTEVTIHFARFSSLSYNLNE